MSKASSSAAFPSGTYAKYKRATGFFLQWLVRARVTGGYGAVDPTTKKTKKKKKPTIDTLDEYARIVSAIAQEPASLPAALSRQWPRAIAACECAITLRAQVAQFYTPTSSEDPHLHFLQRLKDWRAQLCDSNVGVGFLQLYDVLDLPNDYFDAEEEGDVVTIGDQVASAPTLSSKHCKRLAEAPFRDDDELELAYFLLELDELLNAVYEAFCDVKLGKKSLMEATVVVLMAMDFARIVIARFQLCHPHVRHADDLYALLTPKKEDFCDAVEQNDSSSTCDAATSSLMDDRYKCGDVRMDLLWVTSGLRVFVDEMADACDTKQHVTDPYLYRDEMGVAIGALFTLLQEQLCVLFNASIDYDFTNRPDHVGDFFTPLLKCFKTREISIELVFVWVCWARSVVALQGDAWLSRTISLSIQHRWDLEARLRESLERIYEQSYWTDRVTPFEHVLRQLKRVAQLDDELAALARRNPIVAGKLLLTAHTNYLQVGVEVSKATTHVRAFAHLYSALCDRKLLGKIPFFEKFLRFHEVDFFTPSRAAAVHTSFLDVYRAESRKFRTTTQGCSRRIHSMVSRCRCLPSLSKVLRLLERQHFKNLPADVLAPTISWKTRLELVSKLCHSELYGSRILSRDILKISDDITDVLLALRNGLGGNAEFEDLLTSVDLSIPLFGDFKTLENDVMVPVLTLLDMLKLDGSVTMGSSVPPKLEAYVQRFCQRAASIVSAHLSLNKPSRLDNRYYVLSNTPSLVSIEFDDATNPRTGVASTTEDTFLALMEMMTESPAALSEEQVATLKREVKADPTLLSMVVTDPNVELSTLFHHVAAGRARDRRLIEWFIQMGALRYQPKHFQKPPFDEEEFYPSKNLCNYMAVHSAARAGLADIVELILESDFLRDMNKVTYHTKESLAHIAVQNNDHMTFDMLYDRAADCRYKDASGKYVLDYTDNASWRNEIVRLTVWQHRVAEIDRKALLEEKRLKDPTPGDECASLRNASYLSSNEANASEEKAGDRRDSRDETEPAKTVSIQATTELRWSPAKPRGDRVQQLSGWLETLKRDPSDSVTAAAALRAVDTIRASVTYFANSTTLSQIACEIARREAADARQVLNLLTKFYRRLPVTTRDLPPGDDTPLGMLTHRAGPAHAFGDFLAFAMHTASLFKRSRCPPLAQETLELLERRLLKIKRRDASFCETVKTYLRERRRDDFEPIVGTLPEAQRVFQWMMPTANGVPVLDLLGRFAWFHRLVVVASVPSDALEKLRNESAVLNRGSRALWLCVGDCVVVAAHTSQRLSSAVAEVVKVARARFAVRFKAHTDVDNTTDLRVEGLTIAKHAG